MPTNVYFSQKVKSEQNLYEDIIIESLKIYGQDVMYLPRSMIRDNLLNEVVESRFDDAYMVEMYIDTLQGFEGDQTLMSKFGLEIRDQATFIVARRSWEKLVNIYNNDITVKRPMEGDLIYLPLAKTFFEIKFVEHEQPFYQLSNLPVYKLQCEQFEYSNEVLNTDIQEIDEIQRLHANAITFLATVTPGYQHDNFIIGEQLYQSLTDGVTVSAEVVNVVKITDEQIRISVSNIKTSDGKYHEFINDATIRGATSGANYQLTEVYGISNPYIDQTFPESPQAQNRDFEIQADSIIDFSEQNPFGDPSDTYGIVVDTKGLPVKLVTMDSTTITVDTINIRVDQV